MKVFILLCALLFGNAHILIAQDSTTFSKQRKNVIEIGYTSATFFDGYGFKQPTNKQINIIGNAPIYYISYKRHVKHNYFARITYNVYARDYNIEKRLEKTLEFGDLVHRAFYNYGLDLGKTFTLYKWDNKNKLDVNFGISNNYRTQGGETIHLFYPRSWEFWRTKSEFNSYGLGCFTGVNVSFLNRFSIGTDLNYTYYFEKVRIFDQSRAEQVKDIYKPNRHMMTNHLKLGVLF